MHRPVRYGSCPYIVTFMGGTLRFMWNKSAAILLKVGAPSTAKLPGIHYVLGHICSVSVFAIAVVRSACCLNVYVGYDTELILEGGSEQFVPTPLVARALRSNRPGPWMPNSFFPEHDRHPGMALLRRVDGTPPYVLCPQSERRFP